MGDERRPVEAWTYSNRLGVFAFRYAEGDQNLGDEDLPCVIVPAAAWEAATRALKLVTGADDSHRHPGWQCACRICANECAAALAAMDLEPTGG